MPKTMSSTQCTDVDRLIPTYLDGELAESELHSFEHHVSDCEACAAELNQEREFLSQVRHALAAPPAPDTFRARLDRALDVEDQAENKRSRRALGAWVLPGAATIAAAAALLVFALDVVGPSQDGGDGAVAANNNGANNSAIRGADIDVSAGEFLQMPVRSPSLGATGASNRSWQPLPRRTHNAALIVYEQVPIRGSHYRLEVQTMDARNLDLRGVQRRVVRGTTVYVASAMGLNAVSFRDENGVGYVFSSLMDSDDLVDLVVRFVAGRRP